MKQKVNSFDFDSVVAPEPRRRRWYGVLALAITIGAFAAFSSLRRHPTQSAPAPSAMQADKSGVTIARGAPQWEYVKLAVAQQGPAFPPLPAPGRVLFDEKRTASLNAPLPGRIEQVLVRLGDSVTAGAKLFSVRSRDFAELDRQLAAARAAVIVKRRIRDRTKDLLDLNAVPEKELLAAEAELNESALSLRAAEAKRRSLSVAAAGDTLFWVRAPRAGTVVLLDVLASQEVVPERGDPLVRISDTDEVLVTADVPEADATDLVVGEAATIRTRDGLERVGKVQHIATIVDPQRQTVGVRVRAANADRALKPNAFVEVTFQSTRASPMVQVVEDAVVSEGDRTTIFVKTESGRLEKRYVQAGRRRDGMVELRSGLASGTTYVAKGALLLLNRIDLTD